MELIEIIQALMGLFIAIGGYLYRDLKSKVDITQTSFLEYKVHVSEKFVTNEQLVRAIDNINKNVEGLNNGILRIEARMNARIDAPHSTTP